MAIVRFDSGRELDLVQNEMNRLFDGFFDGSRGGESGGGLPRRWIPPMDVAATEEEIVLRADLPGMSEGDVEIEVKDNVLQISGERRSEEESSKGSYFRAERAWGRFARSIALPEGVDPAAVNASFEHGVLEVRVPKPEERKPHRVQIGNGSDPALEGSGTEKD